MAHLQSRPPKSPVRLLLRSSEPHKLTLFSVIIRPRRTPPCGHGRSGRGGPAEAFLPTLAGARADLRAVRRAAACGGVGGGPDTGPRGDRVTANQRGHAQVPVRAAAED
jgi:hypothetical protein